MPSLSYLRAAFAGVLFIACMSGNAPAQQSAKPGTAAVTRVQHIVVRGTAGAIEVEIQTSGSAVAPDTQAITGPDRIVVDFPGALPDAELRALKVNRGPLKAVRSGLFFSNPPITRVVLDLTEPHSYQIVTSQNAVVVKLGPEGSPAATSPTNTAEAPRAVAPPAARLQNTTLSTATRSTVAVPKIAKAVSDAVPDASAEDPSPAPVPEAAPPKPLVTVTYENGMLHIHSEKGTLAQVLFEVQRLTQAEIAIPAGAEQEQVVADLGPGSSREVLASLLNGSPYNFIFVGTEQHIEQVILSKRDNNPF